MEIQSENDITLRFPFFTPRSDPGPIPESGIFDDPLRYAQLNQEWASHVLNVLETLDQPDAWIGTDNEIESARQEIRRLMVSLSTTTAEGEIGTVTTEQYALFTEEGNGAADSVAGWQTRVITHERFDPHEIGAITVGGDGIDLLPGTYRAHIRAAAWASGRAQLRLKMGGSYTFTYAPVLPSFTSAEISDSDYVQAWAEWNGYFVVTDPGSYLQIEQYATDAQTDGLGRMGQGAGFECYLTVELWRLVPVDIVPMGPQGPPGADGADGPQGPQGDQGIQGPQARAPGM